MGTGLFGALMQAWQIPQGELSLIEASIGAAVLDQMAGQPGSLLGAYKAKGGANATTLAVLGSMDSHMKSYDLSPAAKALAAQAKAASFADALKSWAIPSQELALIERTIGAGYLAKMQGKSADLSKLYAALGGTNAQSQQAFKSVEPTWNKVNVGPVVDKIDAAAAKMMATP